MFSPPRIVKEAQAQKLKVGKSFDLATGYDLGTTRGLAKMWRELEEDDPELVCCSPPCTPFSVLQELNFPKMELEKVVTMIGEGLQHFHTSIEVCLWQYHRDKVFLLEHPYLSRAWNEEEAQRLMSLPGVWVCRTDMCEYGLNGGKEWAVESKADIVAYQLMVDCGGTATSVSRRTST